jgi:peroxiredoxin
MKKYITLLTSMCLCILLTGNVFAAATVNQPAPNFTAKTSLGKPISLKNYRGKIVVLEWTNKNCPYVRKHYGTGNMQALQQKYTKKGVVWLTVLSSAKGKSGYLTADQANEQVSKDDAHMSAVILDPEGKLGRLYGARTTPHMFIINRDGVLVYSGAIDSNDSAKPDAVKTATNYVAQALNELLAGKKVALSHTVPYGCGVKY